MSIDPMHTIPLTWLLCGAIFMMAAALLRYKPPRKINHLYGYRTPRSMRNQEIWDFAQHQSARLMMRSGLILFLAGIAALFLPPFNTWVELAIALTGVFWAAFHPVFIIERKLKEKEENMQKPKVEKVEKD